MKQLLDRAGCSEYEAARLIIDHLRGALYHMTSLKGYKGIVRDLAVRPNEGTTFSFPESQLSNCYELKAVSLWDFEFPGEALIYTGHSLRKCQTVLLRHQPVIFIGFVRDRIKPNLKYHKEIKELCGWGGIVPDVEVCHVGQIQLDLATHLLATSLQRRRLRIWKKSGPVLTGNELRLIGPEVEPR